MWDEITYPFPTSTVQLLKFGNFIPQFTVHHSDHSDPLSMVGLKSIHVSKAAPDIFFISVTKLYLIWILWLPETKAKYETEINHWNIAFQTYAAGHLDYFFLHILWTITFGF